jgi:AcrR family transcriptional regulator
MDISSWHQIHTHILELERSGLVTRTFRRLDPERQQLVLNAILEEAIERGPTAINIKQVAVRAGVSVGSLYNYFENRETLLDFTIELCTRYMLDIFTAYKPMLVSMPIREGLMAYLLGGLEWSRTQMGLVRFFLRATYQGDPILQKRVVDPISEVMLEIVREMLKQALARGEVREDIDLEATTRVVHALMIAVGDSQLLPYLNSYLRVTDDEIGPERTMEALLDLVSTGIGAKASARSTSEGTT